MNRISRFGAARHLIVPVIAAVLATAALGCTKDTSGSSSGTTAGDASSAETGMGTSDAATSFSDGGSDGSVFAFDFHVTLGGKTVPFDRGQFGADGADLYLELYDGGDPACPSEKSPTPKHTLIVSGLKKAGTSAPTVTLLDFVGDVITTPKPSRAASAATATMRSASESRLELDLSVTFDADGGGQGSVVGTHCTSLDSQK